jgi:hypothetical protein
MKDNLKQTKIITLIEYNDDDFDALVNNHLGFLYKHNKSCDPGLEINSEVILSISGGDNSPAYVAFIKMSGIPEAFESYIYT